MEHPFSDKSKQAWAFLWGIEGPLPLRANDASVSKFNSRSPTLCQPCSATSLDLCFEWRYSKSPNLCRRCSVANLQHVFEWRPFESIITHDTKKHPFVSSCSLCRIITAIVPQSAPRVRVHLKFMGSCQWTNSLSFITGFMISWDNHHTGKLCPPIHLIPQYEMGDAIQTIRKLQPDAINYTILKKWIHDCRNYHSKHGRTHCTTVKYTEIPYLKLIDCYTRCIVPATSTMLYIALSYVWGNATNPISHEELLPGSLPQTIEDAITVTQRLGMRYLWVDRYCIDQDKADQVTHQIQLMNHIYQTSEVTIIAAAGDDPTYGLPGVGKRHRIPQHNGKIGEILFLATVPSSTTFIRESKWATRAWTYQEAIFSRRRLVFTDYEAYFECAEMNCTESLIGPSPQLRRFLQPSYGGPRYRKLNQARGVFPDEIANKSEDIFERIGEYSGKAFTYQSDVLRGIQGVFRSFEEKFDVFNCWGMPLTGSTSFLASLLWEALQKKGYFVRRPGFPSWSWTGWIFRDHSTGQWTAGPHWGKRLKENWKRSKIQKVGWSEDKRRGTTHQAKWRNDMNRIHIAVELEDRTLLQGTEILEYLRRQNESRRTSRFIHISAWMVELFVQFCSEEVPHFRAHVWSDKGEKRKLRTSTYQLRIPCAPHEVPEKCLAISFGKLFAERYQSKRGLFDLSLNNELPCGPTIYGDEDRITCLIVSKKDNGLMERIGTMTIKDVDFIDLKRTWRTVRVG